MDYSGIPVEKIRDLRVVNAQVADQLRGESLEDSTAIFNFLESRKNKLMGVYREFAGLTSEEAGVAYSAFLRDRVGGFQCVDRQFSRIKKRASRLAD